MSKYAFRHIQGYSAYDHFASEVILRAEAEGRKTKRGMEAALRRAWKACQPRGAGIGPRIDVIRADAQESARC